MSFAFVARAQQNDASGVVPSRHFGGGLTVRPCAYRRQRGLSRERGASPHTLRPMDVQAAMSKVNEVLALVERSRSWVSTDNERYYSEEGRQLSLQIRRLVPVVKRIALGVDPDLQHLFVEQPRRWEWATVHDGLLQLQGLLEHDRELTEILGPQGPQVAADDLHEWVWSAAASLWDDGYRREAVQAAATLIDTHAKAKLGRADISGADRMLQAWTLDAPKKSSLPRFRFTDLESGTEGYSSAHEGAKFFGAGCMLGIRNLLTHSLDQPQEQTALEHLAALSVLARWIDAAEMVVEEPDT